MTESPSPSPVSFVKDTKDPLNEIAALTAALAAAMTQNAILVERIIRIEKAMELQAGEYERRLDMLNGEAHRIREAQSVSVTAEKFESYVVTQREALSAALIAAQDRTEGYASRNSERISILDKRMDRLEADERTRAGKDSREVTVKDTRADIMNRWMIAGVGFLLTVLIIVLNIATSR